MDNLQVKRQLRNRMNWLIDGGEPTTLEYNGSTIVAILKNSFFEIVIPVPFLMWDFYLHAKVAEWNLTEEVIDTIFREVEEISLFDKIKMLITSLMKK